MCVCVCVCVCVYLCVHTQSGVLPSPVFVGVLGKFSDSYSILGKEPVSGFRYVWDKFSVSY